MRDDEFEDRLTEEMRALGKCVLCGMTGFGGWHVYIREVDGSKFAFVDCTECLTSTVVPIGDPKEEAKKAWLSFEKTKRIRVLSELEES